MGVQSLLRGVPDRGCDRIFTLLNLPGPRQNLLMKQTSTRTTRAAGTATNQKVPKGRFDGCKKLLFYYSLFLTLFYYCYYHTILRYDKTVLKDSFLFPEPKLKNVILQFEKTKKNRNNHFVNQIFKKMLKVKYVISITLRHLFYEL